MTDPSITPARPADLPDIHAMVRALSAFHGDTAQVTLAHLQEIFFGTPPQAHALIARANGAPIGYAGLTQTTIIHEGRPMLDIHHLYVRETHRAKGVGTALIEACKDHARAIGATRLTIGTDPRNATAIAAYRAMPILRENLTSGPRFIVPLAG